MSISLLVRKVYWNLLVCNCSNDELIQRCELGMLEGGLGAARQRSADKIGNQIQKDSRTFDNPN
mgnify:CR=1 FL=1